jgi:hypothetical protein
MSLDFLTDFIRLVNFDFKKHYKTYPVLAYNSLKRRTNDYNRLRYLRADQLKTILDIVVQTPGAGGLDAWANKIIGFLYNHIDYEVFLQLRNHYCPTACGQETSCYTWEVDTGCLFCHMDVMGPTEQELEEMVATVQAERDEKTYADIKKRLESRPSEGKLETQPRYYGEVFDLGAML